MPRSQFNCVAIDSTNKIVTTATATVYIAPPFAAQALTTQATVYNNETGLSSPGNPIAMSTGSTTFWAEPGSYDILIQDQSSPKKFDDRVIRFDSIPANQGVIGAMLSPNSVDSSKVQDGSITLADIVAAVGQKLILPGMMFLYGGSVAPTGYMFCLGTAVSRTTYAALFNEIGTTWGAGDGTTTFNLPNFSGRVPVGAGTGPGLTQRTLGATGGAETHQLTIGEMPSHNHAGGAGGVYQVPFGSFYGLVTGANTENRGGDQAHNNMQPFAVSNVIIRSS